MQNMSELMAIIAGAQLTAAGDYVRQHNVGMLNRSMLLLYSTSRLHTSIDATGAHYTCYPRTVLVSCDSSQQANRPEACVQPRAHPSPSRAQCTGVTARAAPARHQST